MYEQLLKKYDLSVTRQRKIILETLHMINHPVTIDELFTKTSGYMNRTTLYRSLRALVDKGLIYQTDFHEGVSYYEFQGYDHHHHITCTVCKKRDKIDICVDQAKIASADTKSYHITHHIFELFGVCKNCL